MNNSSSINQGNIVFTQNGEVYNPIDLDIFLVVAKCICCFIGIPLNVLIAVTIIRLRRLRSKPRNIFLLGIIFSYLVFFVIPIIELIYWGLYPVESVCQAFMAMVAVPQALLLLNMLLSLVDRYVAINHTLFHREKVTLRLASGIIFFSSIFLTFIIKFVYIVGIVPLRCKVYHIHNVIFVLTVVLMLLPCTVLNFIVYRQTKVLIRKSRKLSPSIPDELQRTLNRNNLRMNEDEIDGQDIAIVDAGNIIEPNQLATSGNDSQNVQRPSVSIPVKNRAASARVMSIHVDRAKLSQMEIEATHSLVVGVTSLVVTALPPVIFALIFFSCRLIASQFDCNNLTVVTPYLREFGLIHAVYNPLIFLMRNKELRLAISIKVH